MQPDDGVIRDLAQQLGSELDKFKTVSEEFLKEQTAAFDREGFVKKARGTVADELEKVIAPQYEADLVLVDQQLLKKVVRALRS